MSNLLSQVQKLWSQWHRIITRAVTQIALTLVYLIGIGLTSLVAKLFGKKFLHAKFTDSSWQPMTGSERLEKMF